MIARFKRRAPVGNLAAIMFDLDHFGDFNRQHGHLAGDAVLRLFAGSSTSACAPPTSSRDTGAKSSS